jgi:4-hydroxy-tetrahydrodipicolinate synthase
MKNTLSKNNLRGVFVPLVTPMQSGKFDAESMVRLIKSIEADVDGFVPCLSTGEGELLNDDQWEEIVKLVREITSKLVIAGIKRNSLEEVTILAKKAAEIGCDGFITPVPAVDAADQVRYFQMIAAETQLPFVIYNTPSANVSESAILRELDGIEKIIAIKDSSLNREFFAAACALRETGELQMSVLQGMEDQMDVPAGCDGFLVSLANVESGLVREHYERPTAATNAAILEKYDEYHLESDTWFASFKDLLCERGIIHSNAQVVREQKKFSMK